MGTTTSGGRKDPAPLVDPCRALRAFAASAFDDLPVAVLYFVGSTMFEANAEWVAISRLGAAESAGDGWLTAVHPDDRANAAEFVATTTSRPDVDVSLRIVPVGGQASWFRGRRRCSGGHDDESQLLTLTAVGAHRTNEARLLHMSTHDGLTGLSNRVGFAGTSNRILAASADPAGVLFVDLDHFKVVNDHLGHRFGDDVLRAAGNRINSTIRSTDLAGRLGGDEFGVFCPHVTSRRELFSLAERIGRALATPFRIDGQIVVIDASIGIAFTSETVRTTEALIDEADRAMYLAKAAGGGRWATLDTPVAESAPTARIADVPTLLAARADVDRAEERIRLACQRSSRSGDLERSARLDEIREALRGASLLIRTSTDPAVSAPTDETILDHTSADDRPDRLQATLDDQKAVESAVGMIRQHVGVHTAEATARLRAYAAFAGVTVAIAGRMVVDREVDIDVASRVPSFPGAPR